MIFGPDDVLHVEHVAVVAATHLEGADLLEYVGRKWNSMRIERGAKSGVERDLVSERAEELEGTDDTEIGEGGAQDDGGLERAEELVGPDDAEELPPEVGGGGVDGGVGGDGLRFAFGDIEHLGLRQESRQLAFPVR